MRDIFGNWEKGKLYSRIIKKENVLTNYGMYAFAVLCTVWIVTLKKYIVELEKV